MNLASTMVSAKAVRASNALISSTLPPSPTALFVGATNGIGRATLGKFAENTQSPTVFFVGRSQSAAEELLAELKTKINPQGTYEFLIADCTLLGEVDRVCEIVKGKLEAQGKALEYLCLSCGYLSFGGRDETKEGLDALLTLRYYARLRFITNLLPLQPKHVLSILTGTTEKPVILDDLSLKDPKNYNFIACANHSSTMTTVSLEHLAQQYPKTSFVHSYPGIVKTDAYTNGVSPWVRWLMRWLVLPLLTPFSTSLEECRERCLYYLTSKRYPSVDGRENSAEACGVELGEGVNVAEGEGAYSVGATGEVKPGAVVKEYRENGTASKILVHTMKVFGEAEEKRGVSH